MLNQIICQMKAKRKNIDRELSWYKHIYIYIYIYTPKKSCHRQLHIYTTHRANYVMLLVKMTLNSAEQYTNIPL